MYTHECKCRKYVYWDILRVEVLNDYQRIKNRLVQSRAKGDRARHLYIKGVLVAMHECLAQSLFALHMDTCVKGS